MDDQQEENANASGAITVREITHAEVGLQVAGTALPTARTVLPTAPRILTLGDLQLTPKEWLPKGHVTLHVRRNAELLRVEKLDPASAVSRSRLITTLRKLDPSIDIDAAHQELSRLCEVAPPKAEAGGGDQGHAVSFNSIEAWPEPVDGAALLDEVVATLHRYMVLKKSAVIVIALWLLAAHVYDLFEIFPRLAVRSPAKRCGKTRLLDLLGALLARVVTSSNLSSAVLFRIVEEHHPVLLLDETDRYLRDNPELIGLLNAGHKRGGRAFRCVGEDNTPRGFDVFCPVVIAGIGDPPDTLLDRAFSIDLQRRTKTEHVDRLRASDLAALRSLLVPRMTRWSSDHAEPLQEAQPDSPDTLDDRAADNALPLLAVADLAGGGWPVRARAAVLEICASRQELDDGAGLLLLGDLRDLFNESGQDTVTTKVLVEHLNGLENRPWGEFGKGGRPMTPWHVGALLGKFSIAPTFVTPGEVSSASGTHQAKKLRGYRRTDFVVTWSRYLNPLSLRDSVASAVPLPKTPENAETPLRDTEPHARSPISVSESDDGPASPVVTESRSGIGRTGRPPRRGSGDIDPGDVSCGVNGAAP